MLPTFVIGLREGLEAALIVGIIAAFLRKQGRRDLLRWVFVGVGVAVLLCVAVGVALKILSNDLPQKQQEGLETVVGILAVGMVTYMVVWMRQHSRELKGQLEGLAADAMTGTSNAERAMVFMAFLAVLREGFETVVFLLAAFNEASNTTTAGGGAVLGIVVAIALGYGIYRGGVRINLSKFFRATGLVLVFVAAGLVVTALHTAHEAGWLNAGQGQTIDLTWLVNPGSVQSSLLTGMLGVQPFPVVIEVVGWLLYLIPVGFYVAWPPGRPAPWRSLAIGSALAAALSLGGALWVAGSAPDAPAQRPVTSGGGVSAVVTASGAYAVTVRTTAQQPVAHRSGDPAVFRLASDGELERDGTTMRKYTGKVAGSGTADRPGTLTIEQLAALGHGVLPLGIKATDKTVTATYADATTLTVWLDTRTDRVLDLSWSEQVTASVRNSIITAELDDPIATATVRLDAASRSQAREEAQAAHGALGARASHSRGADWLYGLAVVAALVAVIALVADRVRRGRATRHVEPGDRRPAPVLIKG